MQHASIAEKDQTNTFTDYVYAGGEKIAMVAGEDHWIHLSGTSPVNTWGLGIFDIPAPQNAAGGNYIVQPGDKMCWRQMSQSMPSGPSVWFSNGMDTILNQLTAFDGQLTYEMAPTGAWVNRCFDLTAGGATTDSSIYRMSLLTPDSGNNGNWSAYFADMSITSANGHVTQIIGAQPPAPSASYAGSEANVAAQAESVATAGGNSQAATHYFLADALGTTQLEFSSGGWPVWRGEFAPFGQELDTQLTNNHYKFTGKERDNESGLDYFGARYMSSSMGRFMSPDWSATPAAMPFADPSNPQSLNMYSYVTNNPMNRTDPNGHDWFNVNNKWQWQSGSTYHDANGNATKDKGYAGLLVAQANGTDKKTGATTYSLTLYDQNKVVATGNGFSGGNGMAPVKDGNYMMRLDIRDPAPSTINANSALGNPPPTFGIQPMQNIPAPGGGYYDVTGAYGPGRVRLNPTGGAKDDGDYFHGQTNGHMWTHGCLCYGADNRFINYMWNNMPHAPMPAAIDTPVQKP